jgi:hypothetical protein
MRAAQNREGGSRARNPSPDGGAGLGAGVRSGDVLARRVGWHHDPFGIIDLLNLKVVIHMAVDKAAVDVWIGLWMSVENLWAAA